MSFNVYRLFKHDTFGNAYAVNRDEVWKAKKKISFDTEEEAKEYIINQSKSDIVRFEYPITEEFCEEFCFTNDKYYKYRTLFLGPPNWDKICEGLHADGIKTIEIKN